MRIGLIGVGRIGAFHARNLATLPVIEELVISDAAQELALSVGREVGATVVPEPADVLAAGVDGVVIASSTATHPDLIRACVRAGITTFCEKPVAQSYKEATALAEELAASDVPVQIGFPRRFDPAYVAARDDLLAGSARLPAHGALHDAGPRTSAGGLHPRLRRHLQRLRDPRLRLDPLGHRPGGRGGVRRRLDPGHRLHRRGRRRRDRDVRAHAQRRHHRRGLQHPGQRPRARRTPGDARQRGLRLRRARRAAAAAVGRRRRDLPRRASRGSSSWTGSPTPSAPS